MHVTKASALLGGMAALCPCTNSSYGEKDALGTKPEGGGGRGGGNLTARRETADRS